MTVRYNQPGYIGCSRSARACEAEREGKFPLTRAAQILAERAMCSVAFARRCLLVIGHCEWHHVGKYASACLYYDTEDRRALRLAGIFFGARRRARLLARWTREAWVEAIASRVERELATARSDRLSAYYRAMHASQRYREGERQIEEALRLERRARHAAVLVLACRRHATPHRVSELRRLDAAAAAEFTPCTCDRCRQAAR